MSDNISITAEGRAEMAYVGDTPWHQLGTPLSALQTPRDMIVAAHMDWTVAPRPVSFTSKLHGGQVALPGYRVIVREDTEAPLSVVTDKYFPIQNLDNADLLDAILTEGQATVEVGGVLAGGRQCWLLAQIPDTFEVVEGDTVRTYILIAWAHDGKHGVAIKRTRVRVVCENTLGQALGENWRRGSAVYIPHISGAKVRLEEARTALHLLKKRSAAVEAQYRQLAAYTITPAQAAEYFATVFPEPQPTDEGQPPAAETVERWIARQETLARLYREGKGSDIPGVANTPWAAYNAVTEWTDHVYPVLKNGRVSPARTQGVLFGGYAGLKQRALTQALAFTKA